MIVADTDVLIDALRGHDPGAAAVAAGIRSGALVTTTVTVFELASGAASSGQAKRIDELLAPLSLLPFDERAARRAAGIRRELEAKGEAIGMADYLIAGCCLAHGAELLTRNRHHFERVAGLRLAAF